MIGIGDSDGGGICDAGFGLWLWDEPEGLANAALIVRAVNAHGALVEIAVMARLYAGAMRKYAPNGTDVFLAKIDAALSLATSSAPGSPVVSETGNEDEVVHIHTAKSSLGDED